MLTARNRHRNRRNGLFWLAALLACLLTLAPRITLAQTETSGTHELANELEKRQDDLEKLERKYAELVAQIEKQERHITRLKREQSGQPDRDLIQALRDAQATALEAEAAQAEIQALHRRISNLQTQLYERYSRLLRRNLRQLEQQPSEEKREALIAQILRTLETWDKLREATPQNGMAAIAPPPSEAPFTISADATEEELRSRANLARDHADWLKARMYQTEAHLQRLDTENELRTRLGTFIDEIELFDAGPAVVVRTDARENPEPTEETLEGSRGFKPDDHFEEAGQPDLNVEPETEVTVRWFSPPALEGLDTEEQMEALREYRNHLRESSEVYEKLARRLLREAVRREPGKEKQTPERERDDDG